MAKIIILFAMAFSLAACKEKKDDLLKDEKIRSQIFSVILTNHKYTEELLDSLATNNHARTMMRADTSFINSLFAGGSNHVMKNMIRGIEKDSMTCKDVCMKMMDGKQTSHMMMKTMQEKGIVSKDCMHDKVESHRHK